MAIVSSEKMLRKARDGHYAVGAFNVENMEMAQAVIETAKQLKSPIIIATSQSALKYATPKIFKQMIEAIASTVDIPISLHLDHGDNFKVCLQALHAGYTSIMIDGSVYPYNENVEITKKVVDVCSVFNVPVEAELGMIVGKEQDTLAARKTVLTPPETAKDFVSLTKCNSLAVAIGTCHGFYKEKPNLDYERLNLISNTVDVPLVLHGASGLTEEQVCKCVENGISKVNFATELRETYTKTVKEYLKENPTVVDPKKYGLEAKTAVMECVKEKIRWLGSYDRY